MSWPIFASADNRSCSCSTSVSSYSFYQEMHTTLNDGPTSREIQELPAKVHILLVGLVFVVAKRLYQLPCVVQNDHPGHVGVVLSKKACYKSTSWVQSKAGITSSTIQTILLLTFSFCSAHLRRFGSDFEVHIPFHPAHSPRAPLPRYRLSIVLMLFDN